MPHSCCIDPLRISESTKFPEESALKATPALSAESVIEAAYASSYIIGGAAFEMNGSPFGKDFLSRTIFGLATVLNKLSSFTLMENSSGPRAETAPGWANFALTFIARDECSETLIENANFEAS